MATEVEISNLALSHVGAHRITLLTEATKEARQCNLLYPFARDAALRAHDWSFARKRVTLALLPDLYSGWDFAYRYPTDCLVDRKIYDDTGAYTGTSYDVDNDAYRQVGKVEYEIAVNAALDGKVILTNKQDAELTYTAAVTNPNLFDSVFVEAFSWLLSSQLAVPLKGDSAMQQTHLNQHMLLINNAKVISANEGNEKPRDVNCLVRSRS